VIRNYKLHSVYVSYITGLDGIEFSSTNCYQKPVFMLLLLTIEVIFLLNSV